MPREAALEAIGTAAPREVILESQPGVAASANAAHDPTVIVETYGRNSATLIIDAPRPDCCTPLRASSTGGGRR